MADNGPNEKENGYYLFKFHYGCEVVHINQNEKTKIGSLIYMLHQVVKPLSMTSMTNMLVSLQINILGIGTSLGNTKCTPNNIKKRWLF